MYAYNLIDSESLETVYTELTREEAQEIIDTAPGAFLIQDEYGHISG